MRQSNNESNEVVPSDIIISFSNNNQNYDLEIKLFSENSQDRLQIIITDRSSIDLYYQTIFSMETLPKDFTLIYDTLPELFQYIIGNYQEVLEIELDGEKKQKAFLKIKVLIIKKMKQFKLVIEGKPLTAEMKEEADLLKLTQQIEAKLKNFTALAANEAEINRQVRKDEEQIKRLEEEQKVLVEKVAKQLEVEQKERESSIEMRSRFEAKKKQVLRLHQQLSELGLFNQQEVKLCMQVVKISAPKNTYKKMLIDSSDENSQIVIMHEGKKQIKQVQKIPPSKDKAKFIQQNIPPNKSSKPQESKPLVQQTKIENVPTKPAIPLAKRTLQIKDSEDSSKSPNGNQLLKFQKQEKQMIRGSLDSCNKFGFQSANAQMMAIQGINSLQSDRNTNAKNIVTVLSSQSEEVEVDQYSKEVGVKVGLDFSGSEHMNKYRVEKAKSRIYIERTYGDNNFYHLYHKYPIKDRQSMQVSISNINKKDFTFGIMGREALKVSRLEWPKDVVCWVGCNRQVFNQLEGKKVDKWMSPSDSITVSVDCHSSMVTFYLNKKLIHQEKAAEKIIKQCYFFFQTATKGNKLYYI